MELRALVARQAAAILRLLNHLAKPGGGAAAIAAPGAPAPALAPSAATEPQPPPPMKAIAPARAPPATPARPPLLPAAASQDSGGDMTLDQVQLILLKALKLPTLRSKQPTIGGSLSRMGRAQRMKTCKPMTEIWMENCGLATNESDPIRIVAAALPPKVVRAAALLVAGVRVKSEKSVKRDTLRVVRNLIAEKKLRKLIAEKETRPVANGAAARLTASSESAQSARLAAVRAAKDDGQSLEHQGWPGRSGAPTSAPRPAPPGKISAPRPAPPSAPA